MVEDQSPCFSLSATCSLCKWDFQPRSGGPQLIPPPPFWPGVRSLLQAQLSRGLGLLVFVVLLWQGSGLAGKAFF